MSTSIILVNSTLAQSPAASPAAKTGESPPLSISPFLILSAVLAVALVGLTAYGKFQIDQFAKKAKFEEFKNQELKKKLKLALGTITKMETNPDLVHSREFNLDYLRMRMEEEVFHFAIVNQIKVKVKDKISEALRPSQAKEGKLGVSAAARQVDEIFDVEYEPGDLPKGVKRVLFRIQIKLTKLPAVPTSQTVSQIIDCIETYLSPTASHDNWQPAMGGRLVNLHWDQKAKPTPLLVLEQLNEGSNVTIRTTRRPPIALPKEEAGGAATSAKTPAATGDQPQKSKGQSRSNGQSQQGKSRGSSSRVSRSGRPS